MQLPGGAAVVVTEKSNVDIMIGDARHCRLMDAQNRLVQVADDGTPITSFTCDGAGRMSERQALGDNR